MQFVLQLALLTISPAASFIGLPITIVGLPPFAGTLIILLAPALANHGHELWRVNKTSTQSHLQFRPTVVVLGRLRVRARHRQ